VGSTRTLTQSGSHLADGAPATLDQKSPADASGASACASCSNEDAEVDASAASSVSRGGSSGASPLRSSPTTSSATACCSPASSTAILHPPRDVLCQPCFGSRQPGSNRGLWLSGHLARRLRARRDQLAASGAQVGCGLLEWVPARTQSLERLHSQRRGPFGRA